MVLFNLDAQHFILDNIDCVLNYNSEKNTTLAHKKENQGTPWTHEQEQALIQMFNRGITILKMANTLQRTPQGISARLKKLGIT